MPPGLAGLVWRAGAAGCPALRSRPGPAAAGTLGCQIEAVWNEPPLSHINSDSVNEEQKGMKREGTFF